MSGLNTSIGSISPYESVDLEPVKFKKSKDLIKKIVDDNEEDENDNR